MKALLILAGAAAIAQPLPPMRGNDVTAQFQGDGGAIKFDPACRDYTVTTISSAPACFKRVEKGETAPSLAIATKTILDERGQVQQAIAILQHAAQVEDHPATHYLLGVLLGTGQAGAPRYKDAVRHLEIASSRGNPAAADLLATLLVQGKGTTRDIPKAVALYKQALAGGFLASASSLAQLYLTGRYLPVDRDFGARLLEEAARLGDARALELAPLARTDKIHNFQLLPAADPTRVRVKDYDSFSNPEIPPNFGYDEALQSLHHGPFDDEKLLDQLKRNTTSNPTPYLYELARREAPGNPADGLRHYVLARVRMTYDAARCGDSAALEAPRAWDMLIIRDIAFVFSTLSKAERENAIKQALEDENSFPADTLPWWVCRSGLVEMNKAMAGKVGPLVLKPETEWPKIREEVRKRTAAAFLAIP